MFETPKRMASRPPLYLVFAVALLAISVTYAALPAAARTRPSAGRASSFPAVPASLDEGDITALDPDYNQLPFTLSEAAVATIDRAQHGVLVGGMRDGSISDGVSLIDVDTGELTSAGTLPQPRRRAAAVYVPNEATLYVFGGQDDTGTVRDTVYTIPIGRLVPDGPISETSLPTALTQASAVYHPGADRVYVFGGRDELFDQLDTIYRFNPHTGQADALTTALPIELHATAAAYSPLTGRIYLFGGVGPVLVPSSAIYAVTLDEAGDIAQVEQLAAALPQPDSGLAAALDPNNGLIYLAGGSSLQHLLAFDPVTGDLWQTPVQLPEHRVGPGLFYHRTSGHALVVGGAWSGSQDNVWKIALGDGPVVPVGHWTSPDGVSARIDAIDGAAGRVFLATRGDGLWRYDAGDTRTQFTAGNSVLETNQINDVRYDLTTDYAYVAADNGWTLNNADDLFSLRSGSPAHAVEVRPGATNPLNAYFFGTDNGVLWRTDNGIAAIDLDGQVISSLALEPDGYVAARSGDTIYRLVYNPSTGDGFAGEIAQPCVATFRGFSNQMRFDAAGNMWTAIRGKTGAEFEYEGGICFIPSPVQSNLGLYYDPFDHSGFNGRVTSALDVSVDDDSRVWFVVNDVGGTTDLGYLNAYEAVLDGSTTVGINNELYALDSTASAVGAVGERVWVGHKDGSLTTVAQRWQQLESSNSMGTKVVDNVWLARGRAFFAAGDTLHVLLPDGQSWESYAGVTVHALLADSRGRIWLGTDAGLRFYTPGGLEPSPVDAGDPPSTAVIALTEDRQGRVWIGSQGGLTLYDRERFVVTLTAANSDLPHDQVNALLVDRQDRLWAGTGDAFDNVGGLGLLDRGRWTVYDSADGLPADAVIDLAELPDGRIAVSTRERVLFLPLSHLSLFDGTIFEDQALPRSEEAALYPIPLTVDDEGRLWAGAAVLRPDGWHAYYDTNSGLASSLVGDVAADDADQVWFVHAPDPGVSVRGTTLPPLSNALPFIDSTFSASGGAGDTITIPGSGFGTNPDAVSVRVGGREADVTAVDSSSIIVAIDEEMQSGSVSVSVNGQRVTLGSRTDPAFCAIPSVEGVDPPVANDGMVVDVVGANLDPNARVSLGSGPFKERYEAFVGADTSDPRRFQVLVTSDDTGGSVTVENECGGSAHTTQTTVAFERTNLEITDIRLNQGISGLDPVNNKATMVRAFVSVDPGLPVTDTLEIDEMTIVFTNDVGDRFERTIPRFVGAVPNRVGDPTAADLADIENSINGSLTPELDNAYLLAQSVFGGGEVTVEVVLRRRDVVVARETVTREFLPDIPMRVLLVPVVRGWNMNVATDVEAVRARYMANIEDLERRIWPTGRVEVVWADSHILTDDGEQIEIGGWDTFRYAEELDRARQAYNAQHEPDALAVAGVVLDPSNNSGGHALWADVSALANLLALDKVDAVCDVVNGAVRTITFGLVGDEDGCELDIPLYVALLNATSNDDRLGGTLAHELGHTVGLVKPYHSNGALTDNVSHSVNDELDGGECADLGAGASYNREKTLYRQPGVVDPVVNPLSGGQWRPDLGLTGTEDGVTSEAYYDDRGKAIMSYACEDRNDNSYFEPVDYLPVYLDLALQGATQFIRDLRELVSASATASATVEAGSSTSLSAVGPTRAVAGERLYVAGLIDRNDDSSTFTQVEVLDATAEFSLPLDTGYWLVQLNDAGMELGRDGVFAVFTSSGQESGAFESDEGFFAATVARRNGVATLELRREDTVLASYEAGAAAPQVNVTSPTSGSYGSGSISVAWTASDPDGDDVSVVVEYSADGGATWTAIAFAQGGGSEEVPVSILAGSDDARFRVTASDGFNRGSDTSPAFSVAPQPPNAYVSFPNAGDSFLEGERIVLLGGALDNQDGEVVNSGLTWSSDRDGALGSGSELGARLSVGSHVLTLRAENSAGLVDTATVTATVEGDYDYDGMPDAAEAGDGLNPLTSADALADPDGDGLTTVVERRRGTDPSDPDIDGDGRSDGDEVASGTDPATVDDPLTPDELGVAPESFTFQADLSKDAPLPQQQLTVVSRRPADWHLTADVPWLSASKAAGRTVDAATILVDAYALDDGVHRATLTVLSDELSDAVSVPVTVTIENSGAYFDVDDNADVNIGDVQSVAGAVPSTWGEPGFDYHRDIDRDGTVDLVDADLIAGRWQTDHACCSASYPEAAATLSLAEAPDRVVSGDLFTVLLRIRNGADVGGFETTLGFDTSVLQVEDVVLDTYLGESGRTTYALTPIEEAAGLLVVGGYTIGDQAGAAGEGTLARVTFRATASGAVDIALQDSLLAAPDGTARVPTGAGADVYLPIVVRR